MQDEIIEYDQDFTAPRLFLKDLKDSRFLSKVYAVKSQFFKEWGEDPEPKSIQDWLELKTELVPSTNKINEETEEIVPVTSLSRVFVYVMAKIIRVCKTVGNCSLLIAREWCSFSLSRILQISCMWKSSMIGSRGIRGSGKGRLICSKGTTRRISMKS